jgi:YidC/Oxa1 family membrane protein insertase
MKFRRNKSYHLSSCVAALQAISCFIRHFLRHVGILFVALIFAVNSPVAYGSFKVSSSQFSGKIDIETLEAQIVSPESIPVEFEKLVRDGPLVSVKMTITNSSDASVELENLNLFTGVGLTSEQDEKAGLGASYYSYLDPFVAKRGEFSASRLDEEILAEELLIKRGDWFGWTSRYHFEAVRFSDCSPGCSVVVALNKESDASDDEDSLTSQSITLLMMADSKNLGSGESFTLSFDLLAAPKSRTLLTDPGVKLESLLLYNLWDWLRGLSFIIWDLLDFLFEVSGNWGMSIILLALIVRIIFIPITRFSLSYQKRAIQQQTDIAPLLAAVKRDYAGAEQSEKILGLYKDQHYDQLAPFKSMAGLFIQIPIFIALFNVLGDAWKISGQSFLWIPDLARSDRLFDWGFNLFYFGSYFNLLPVLMAAVTIISTWLAGRQAGKTDVPTTTLFGMGGLFFVLFYSFPAALVLYWMSSNFFQLVQQTVENRLQMVASVIEDEAD